MNYPSHANSSVGQVANAYMGNPQALQQRTQPQNGVTPELIDLLALQKLQADKDAAARQMALQSGQTPPTVAQGLEQSAMQSARQEIAQKLGLPGLMNQGQNVPQAPGGQPPQGAPQAPAPQGPQPMQRMAQGGLARIPSNLPRNYAGGGIIAFAGANPDGTPSDQQVPDTIQESSTAWQNLDKKPGESDESYVRRVEAAKSQDISFDPTAAIRRLISLSQGTKPLTPSQAQAKSMAEVNKVDMMDLPARPAMANDPRLVNQPAPVPAFSYQDVRSAEKSDSPLPSDPFAASVNLLLQNEGGYKKADNNGHEVNMGINAKFHPNEDIKGMTRDRAAEIYKNQYWNAIGGDALAAQNPALAAAALDAAANQGVSFTNKALKESGGDINSFLALRKQRYEELAQNNPEQYGKELKGWNNRLDKLASGLNSTAFQATAYSPDQAGQATKPGAQPVATNTQPPVSGIDKILSYAKTSPVQGPVEQSVIRSVGQDADTTPIAREAARQKIIGPSQTAAIEAQQQGLANTAAGQAAIKAARPSDWQTWLQAVGSNLHNGSGLGGATAGVASAMDKARMGYATENATHQAKLDTLNQAMKDALAQNDIGRANAIDKQRTDVEANIRAGQTAGASMVATTATENARVESTLARFEQAQQVAQQNNDTKLQNTLAGIDARITKAASDQAAAQAKTIPGMMDADIPALAAKIRAQMLATDPSYNAVIKKLGIEAPLPTPTATAAPTMRYNSATKKLEAV